MQRSDRTRVAYILGASLDPPEFFKPVMKIFTDEAHSWDVTDKKPQKFPDMPPMPDDLDR